MAQLRDEIAFKFRPDGLDVYQMDPSHVGGVHLNLPLEIWEKYTSIDRPILLNVKDMDTYLKRLKSEDVVVLKGDLSVKPEMLMGIRGTHGFRRFGLAVMEPGDENEDPPLLKGLAFDVKAKISIPAFAEALADAEAVSGTGKEKSILGSFTIEARSKPERLVVWCSEEGTFKSSWYEFLPRVSLIDMECARDKVKSVYGALYMKPVVSANTLSNIMLMEYTEDYPVKFTCQLAFPGVLEFFAAPRIEVT